MTYFDRALGPGAQTRHRFKFDLLLEKARNALHVLLQLDDELRNHRRDVVPVMRGVLDLLVYKRVLDALAF